MHKDTSKKGPPYHINPLLQSSSIPFDKPSHTKQSDPVEEFQERITKIADQNAVNSIFSSSRNI
jgi:hypothetical protein